MRRFKTTYEKVLRCIWETNATASSLLLGGTTCRVQSLSPTILERAAFHTKRMVDSNYTATRLLILYRHLEISLQGRQGSTRPFSVLGCRDCKDSTFFLSAGIFSGQEQLGTQTTFYTTSNAPVENSIAAETGSQSEKRGDESVEEGHSFGSITLTSGAIAKLKDLRQKKGAIDLRLQVDGGGCSGFQYVFKLDAEGPKEDDVVIDADGVRLLCDSVSMEFLGGSTVDYESDLMRSGFVVTENPNAEMGCGCGSSFAVKL